MSKSYVATIMDRHYLTDTTLAFSCNRAILGKYDEEAAKIIKDNYEMWMNEELDNAIQKMDKPEKGIPAKKAFKKLKKEMRIHHKKKRMDIKKAIYREPKYTEAGNRVIDANEALWLLKTKHNELKFK